MKKLLFVALFVTSSLLSASIPATGSTTTRIAQADLTDGTLTPQQVQETAKNITVRITSENNGGSGTIIAQKGDKYLILTNAHIIRRASKIEIRASDGQKYQATPIDGGFNAKYDLALLQFTSRTKYTLANLTNIAGSTIDPTRTIYSSGFPFDAKEIRITQGQISQLSDIPFDDGTQIGYIIDKDKQGMRQGMSGGAIFDSQGNFLGINTVGIAPILPDYTYNDGSKPLAKLKAQYRQANWGIPVYNFLTNVKADILYGYDNLPKVERQVTPTGYFANLNIKARQVTVRIENSGGTGSGVIVAREGDSYYVLTAKHVLYDKNTSQKFTNNQVITYDQDRRNPSGTVVAEGVDLAVVKFNSKNDYSVAKLNESSPNDDDLVFVGGFPKPGSINSPLWQWQLNPGFIYSREMGKVWTQNKFTFTDKYDLLYSSISYGGMSGGPVFDRQGNIIGIHGKAEGENLNSAGISIQTFTGLLKELRIDRKLLKITDIFPKELSNEEKENVQQVMENTPKPEGIDEQGERSLVYAQKLYRTHKYQEAVTAFEADIISKKQVLSGNYGKALALLKLGKYQAAADAIALAIVPAVKENDGSSYSYLWRLQSGIFSLSGKGSQALLAINTAIAKQDKYSVILFLLLELIDFT